MSYNSENYMELGGKKWVIGTNGEINILGTFNIGSAEVTVGASELNLNDLSAQTETLSTHSTADISISTTKKVTKLNFTGNVTLTLGAPDATMLGQVKIIEDVQTATNTCALAITNLQGTTASATITFDASNETLVLVAGTNKWNVISEIGVSLT